MPEMPEVEGLRSFLDANLVGRTIASAHLAAFSALKTFEVPLSALQGLDVERVERRGKFLAIGVDGVWLAFHLARAGWLTWHDPVPATAVRPTKGPLALRVTAEGPPLSPDADDPGDGPVGFSLTEAGTQKHLAVYVVTDLMMIPGVARLGPDPLADGFDLDAFRDVLAAHARTQLKGLLKDQSVLAGIGNAYSDEILQAARLSPFKLAGSLTTPSPPPCSRRSERTCSPPSRGRTVPGHPSSKTANAPTCASMAARGSPAPPAAPPSPR